MWAFSTPYERNLPLKAPEVGGETRGERLLADAHGEKQKGENG
jgi:hypothetical protein